MFAHCCIAVCGLRRRRRAAFDIDSSGIWAKSQPFRMYLLRLLNLTICPNQDASSACHDACSSRPPSKTRQLRDAEVSSEV